MLQKILCRKPFVHFGIIGKKWNQLYTLNLFLYSVTRNTVLNYIKHQKIRLRYEQSLHDLEDKTLFEYFIIEEEVERILLKTQENLPPKCKRIFILAIQGKNNDEIAKELNISVNTVKTQKKIAYRTLKDYIYEITCLLFLLQK